MFPSLRAPETMTTDEQALLLKATAAHDDPRDHTLYSMALGTGLRLQELLGLNVGDVSQDGRQVRRRVVLDPATTKGGKRGEVFLPARLILVEYLLLCDMAACLLNRTGQCIAHTPFHLCDHA